jgi:pyruvate/2-oxoglutarate dehydrogenase complex dihydrolipoamide dehydrogenase (E3) component
VTPAAGQRHDGARWPRPRSFDRNLVVIGAGAAGLTAAYLGATLKARVTLVEAATMGGDCLNYGCVPSKALLHAAGLVRQIRGAAALGVDAGEPQVDFARVMERVHSTIATIAPHDSVERFAALGVDVVRGRARLTSPWQVEIETADGVRTLTTRAVVVATGSEPVVAKLPGLDGAEIVTTDTVWALRTLPGRLLVLGGGPVGCELAQAFARLGAEVTVVEAGERVLGHEDEDASKAVQAALRDDGVTVFTGHKVLRVEATSEGRHAVLRHHGGERRVPFDAVLSAIGRRARTAGLGLEALGIAIDADGTVATDAALRSRRHPHIVACGDVAGPWQLTHAASHQAGIAAINALFGARFDGVHAVMPWTTFTDPEVARVGVSEHDAKRDGVDVEITRVDFAGVDRAIVDDASRGFVKLLTTRGNDRIIGATIVGEHAGELLAEVVLAMTNGIGLDKIARTVHAYPTLAEVIREAALQWRLGHVPGWLRRAIEWFFTWRRRGFARRAADT